MSQPQPAIGVIGGSGLYEMEGLKEVREVTLETPFGQPSDAYVTGVLHGRPMVFLPRHGRGHRFLPSEVPYAANIWGMKRLGVRWVVSVSAVGSMKEEIAPGHIVFPHQFIDLTKTRRSTFFGNGIVGHAVMADPVDVPLAIEAAKAARAAGATVHEGGAYVCIEGPQFSTKAESAVYRSWGVDVIGMTNATEAKLAREAELSYCTVALSTDYDCWHPHHESVTVEDVIRVLNANIQMARNIIDQLARNLPSDFPSAAEGIMAHATLTHGDRITPEARTRMALLLGKYLG